MRSEGSLDSATWKGANAKLGANYPRVFCDAGTRTVHVKIDATGSHFTHKYGICSHFLRSGTSRSTERVTALQVR